MSTSTPRTIPSEFVKLDAEVTAADRFVNVRDRQTIRDNQNALYSGAHFRVVHTACQSSLVTNRFARHLHHRHYGVDSVRALPCMYFTRVRLSRFVTECSFVMYAGTTRALDFDVFPVLSRPGDQRDVIETQLLTVNTAGVAYPPTGATKPAISRHETTVTVPFTSLTTDGYKEYDFAVYGHPAAQGATILGAPDTLTAASSTSVTVTAGPHNIWEGDIMYFPSNLAIEPRYVEDTSIPLGAGGLARVNARAQWLDNVPAIGDTVQFIESPQLMVHSVQLIEKVRTTDFDTLSEVI